MADDRNVKQWRRSMLRLMLVITFGMGELVGLLIGASGAPPAYAGAVLLVGSAVFWAGLPSYRNRDGEAERE